MILQNERQYDFARIRLANLEAALRQSASPESTAIARDGCGHNGTCLIEELRVRITEYEKICAGQVKTLLLDDVLAQLPATLVRARIARGWTQRQLAERLGTSEQQVQKDEAGAYARANLEKLGRIAGVLGVSLSGRAKLTCSTNKLRSARRAASTQTKRAVSSR